MVSPYISPVDLLGNPQAPPTVSLPSDAATLGVDFSRVTLQRLEQLCYTATGICDTFCGLELRATSFYEQLLAPSKRVGTFGGGWNLRFITSRKPILSVISGQYGWGPPFTWQPIPTANIAPEEATFGDLGAPNWNGATSGQAALIIGAGWAWGPAPSTWIGVRYLSGWPTAGVLPAAVFRGDVFAGTNTLLNVVNTTGVEVGAPLTGLGLPSLTFVSEVEGTTVTISQKAQDITLAQQRYVVGYAPGVTSMLVDDVTVWGLGVWGQLFDGMLTEGVNVSSATAITSGLETPAGPGTVYFSQATLNPHLPGILLSAMPANIRWAAMLIAKAQYIERGAPAVSLAGMNNRSSSTRNPMGGIWETVHWLLRPYQRVY